MRTPSIYRLGRAAITAAIACVVALSLATEAAAQFPTIVELPEEGESLPLGRQMPLPIGTDEDFRRELSDFERALEVYEQEVGRFTEDITRILRSDYARRRAAIDARYAGVLDESQSQQAEQRESAIHDLQRFVMRYPDHPRYTPDVLYRLAWMQFQQGFADEEVAHQLFAADMRRYELGILPEPPQDVRLDLRPAIATFSRLIREFPDYRSIDAALYTQSIALESMAYSEQAEALLEQLVAEHSGSEYAPDAWLRLGEYRFESLDYRGAIEAYHSSLAYGEDNTSVDTVLFKTGWARYLLGQYDEAIATFRELLDYYDNADSSVNEGARVEALQYLAIVLHERDWDSDGEVDADFLAPRLEHYLGDNPSWALEVLDELYLLFFNLEPRSQFILYAIETYEFAVGLAPYDLDAPSRHEQLLLSQAYLGDEDALTRILGEIALLYSPGTRWYEHQVHEGELDSIIYAEELTKIAALEGANRVYIEADELRQRAEAQGDRAMLAQAEELYRQSSILYDEFINSWPNDEQVYATRMQRAFARFYGRLLMDAFADFVWVRDSPLSAELREESAAWAILSLTAHMESEIEAGRLEARALPGYEQQEYEEDEDEEIDPRQVPRMVEESEELPELARMLLDAYDVYTGLPPVAEEDPESPGRIALQSVSLLFDYKHNDEARERAIAMMDTYCGQDSAGFAAYMLIMSYQNEGNFREMEYWANQVSEGDCAALSGDQAARFERIIADARMWAVFASAEQYLNERQFEEAAAEYIRFAESYPDLEEAAIALFNAGITYEVELRRYEAAIRQFQRLYERYPDDALADRALVRVALNANRFFDFDRAISTFLLLHERGVTEGLTEDPQLQAADLLRYSQRYTEAAEVYLSYATRAPSTAESALATFRAALMYERAERDNDMVSTFERFIQRYGRDDHQPFLDTDAAVMDAFDRILQARVRAGNARAIRQAEDALLAEFDRRQPPATNLTNLEAASRIVYERAAAKVEEWDSTPISGNWNQLQRVVAQRREAIPELVLEFEHIQDNYGHPEYMICSMFQQGLIADRFADRLAQTEIPPEIVGHQEAEDDFILFFEDIARGYEDAAIDNWAGLYQLSQEAGIHNHCTTEANRRLSRLSPEDYPIPKITQDITPESLTIPSSFEGPAGVDDDDIFVDGPLLTGDSDEETEPSMDADSLDEENPFDD